MNIEEAIKTAIEYEVRVRELYNEACEETASDVGKRLFKLLADEEHAHVTYLEVKLVEWNARQVLSSADLKTSLPSMGAIREAVGRLESKFDAEHADKELGLLEKALRIEEETSGFYEKMVAELPEQGRAFFKGFVETEKGHVALVRAEIDALKGTGFYFDMPEFDVAAR